jgi:ABC-type phosphate transport system substrate-binding protein
VVKQKMKIKELRSAAAVTVIKGSDTVLPLAQKKLKNDENKFDVSVTVVGGGSGVGINGND